MMKKIFYYFTSLIFICFLAGCQMASLSVPSASIYDISFSEDDTSVSFKVRITDSDYIIEDCNMTILDSSNTEFAKQELEIYGPSVVLNFDFDNLSKEKYTVYISASYHVRGVKYTDLCIASKSFTPGVYSGIQMSSKTFTYDGTTKYLEVENAPKYSYIEYTNNFKKNAGTYEVTAKIYVDGELLKTISNTLTIEKADFVVNTYGSDTCYKGIPQPYKDYSSNFDSRLLTITYNGSKDAPVDAGTYEVEFSFAGNNNINPYSKTITYKIEKAQLYAAFLQTTFTDVNKANSCEPIVAFETTINGESEFITINSSTLESEKTFTEFIENDYGTHEISYCFPDSTNYIGAQIKGYLVYEEAKEIDRATDLFISQVSSLKNGFILCVYNNTSDVVNLDDYLITWTDSENIVHYSKFDKFNLELQKNRQENIQIKTQTIAKSVSIIKKEDNNYKTIDSFNFDFTNDYFIACRKPNIYNANNVYKKEEWFFTNDINLIGVHRIMPSQYYPQILILGTSIDLEYKSKNSLEEKIIIIDELFGFLDKDYYTITNIYGADLGTYSISIEAKNSINNSIDQTISVEVKDTTGPKIECYYDHVYTYLGVETDLTNLIYAYDNYDGIINITSDMIVESNLDITKAGIYTVKYCVKDSLNNLSYYTLEIEVR